MALIARRSFKYGSRHYAAGDVVPLRPQDRKLMRALKWVEEGPEPVAVPEGSYPQYEPSDELMESLGVKKKRKYQRRDMQADE